MDDPWTVPALLAWRTALHPDHTAIEVHGVGTLTFADWRRGAAAVAAALSSRGVGCGDRVALVFGARDWCDFAIAYCGVQTAGAVAVPLSDRLAPTQLRYVLEHCSAVAGIAAAPAALSTSDTPAWTVSDLIADDVGQPGPPCLARSDDLAQVLYTSGTTGRPKGVAATHRNLTAGAPPHPRRMALAHSKQFLHAFAIGTNAGQTMLLNALTAKASALTMPHFTPVRFARLIASPGVGSVFVVPSMAVELLNSGALDGVDASGVHLIGSTAAPLPPTIAAGLAKAFPEAAIVNYYTSTEAAPAQTVMVFDPARPDSVGRAVDGMLRITDAQGTVLRVGEVGEVWLRTSHPRTYFRDDAASKATFRGGWVRMGDLGRVDDAGFLYLVDRQSDVIKSGANKISTLEIEAALHECPAVAEAAVVGIPHPVLGALVAAAVVGRPGAPPDDVTLVALRGFLAGRLADHQLPGRVLVLDALPRNEGGKVLKSELIKRFDSRDDRSNR